MVGVNVDVVLVGTPLCSPSNETSCKIQREREKQKRKRLNLVAISIRVYTYIWVCMKNRITRQAPASEMYRYTRSETNQFIFHTINVSLYTFINNIWTK